MANEEKKKNVKATSSATGSTASGEVEQIDFASSEVMEELIARFGGLRPFANSLGLAVGTVQGWKKRNSVPIAHQQRIRELLGEKGMAISKLGDKGGSKDKPIATSALRSDSPSKIPADTPPDTSANTSNDERVAIEESLVSAFTGEDSSSSDEQDSGLDISKDVWEHAALPRSTSGHWAMLISFIALIGVLTRPLWAERIDAKLMATIAGDSHSTESHADDTADTSTDSKTSAHQGDDDASQVEQDLLGRLLELEKKVSSVDESQGVLDATEMRRLKSESSALAAAFDSQAARLDSLSKLLQEREETLASLRKKVERVEKNNASVRLTQRLNALFELENIAYEIAQNTASGGFSLQSLKQALEQALPSHENESLSRTLTTLGQANSIATPRQLLLDYRLLLPDLLTMQAHSGDASLGERFRAQLFTVFSIRHRGDETDRNPFLKIEQLLEEHSNDRAEKLLQQTTAPWLSGDALEDGTKIKLGAETDPSSLKSRLASFQAKLAARNSVFAAMREIRQKLSSDSSLSQGSLDADSNR